MYGKNMLCVVKAFYVVSRFGVVCTPALTLICESNLWFRKTPVDVVHHVKPCWNIFVEIRLWQIVCHVVEEVDVPERPTGVILRLWTHLEILNIEIKIFLNGSDRGTHLVHHLFPAVVFSWDNHFVHVQQCDPVISVFKCG